MTERKVSHAQQIIAFITGLSIFGPAEFIKSAFIIATIITLYRVTMINAGFPAFPFKSSECEDRP